ncbi:hypothetical protein GGF32_001423 [Allomyces javanicus]|nr:hypothetical protein GGF32_001423 [Allomyces javanicus]
MPAAVVSGSSGDQIIKSSVPQDLQRALNESGCLQLARIIVEERIKDAVQLNTATLVEFSSYMEYRVGRAFHEFMERGGAEEDWQDPQVLKAVCANV